MATLINSDGTKLDFDNSLKFSIDLIKKQAGYDAHEITLADGSLMLSSDCSEKMRPINYMATALAGQIIMGDVIIFKPEDIA